ncbi:MAG: MarR family transcriptional regulator [Pelobium sp.]
MAKYEEPLVHQLIQVTKKYLNAFSESTENIPLERYHYALLLIDENGESLTQKALAKLLEVDKSFMVGMIDYLTNSGYVYRETNAEDRRQHVIKLTEKAKEIIPEINQSIHTVNQKAFGNLPDEKVNLFYEMIGMLQTNLNAHNTHEIAIDYQNRNLST